MNKRGGVFLSISIALIIFVAGVLIIPFIADDITTTRVSLNCESTSITGGNMITCLLIDLSIPYIIWFILSLVLGLVIGGKI
jgi:hypothetical protein